jgi:hypothetical protein
VSAFDALGLSVKVIRGAGTRLPILLLHIPNHGLPAAMDVYVFDPDILLAAVPQASQNFHF